MILDKFIAQVQRWTESCVEYAADVLKINTVDATLEYFVYNNIQIALDEIVADIRAHGRFVRLVILKLRRAGASTWYASRIFWLTNMNPHTYGLMVGHDPESAETLFSMHKRFHANLPSKIRPQVLYDNRKILEFNTKSRIGGLDSAIRVAAAGKENLGSSQLVNFCHLSELPKWPQSLVKPILTSLMPCIPKTPESELVVESTAYGVGNVFHKMYVDARYKYKMYLNSVGDLAWECKIDEKAPPGNTWSAVFIPCYVFERNQLAVSAWEAQTGLKFERTAEEKLICDLYLKGCTDARANKFLCWRRMSIADDFNGDVSRFNQENPLSDIEAFISSGETAFDTHRISARLDAAQPPIARYEIDPATGQFISSPTGRLWVWEEPKAGEAYAIPADIAKGIVVENKHSRDDVPTDSKHDFSVCSVKHQLTRREVAQWHGKIDPDQFGRLLVFLAIRYNMAWIIPESNNHGHTTIATIVGSLPGQMKYKKVYAEVMERPPNKPRREYGFNTRGGPDGGVRLDAVNALIAAERDDKDGIRSSRTFEEMLSFKRNAKGKYEAEVGHHDDCITVEFIAAYAIPLLPLPANAPRKPPLAVPGGPPAAPTSRGGAAKIHPGFT